MKMTTGRIANPRKRRAPAKRKTVAKRRRRRANPGHMRAVIPQTMVTRAHYAPEVREANPRRRKAAGHSSGGIFVSPSGRTLTRRANPRGPGVVAGVSITETALMVLSGGAAAFAGAVAVRFVDEKMRNKWGRIGIKSGLALVVGFCGMKAAESQAMGGRIVLPIAIGFAAPMIASAIDDIFDKPITTSALINQPAAAPLSVADEDEDDDDTINGLDPLDDIDDDVASLYESGDLDDDMDGLDDYDDEDDEDDEDDDMDGFGPQLELMGSTVMSNPARGLSSFAANFMQGLTMARA